MTTIRQSGAVWLCILLGAANAGEPPKLDDRAFRRGLQTLGLTDLLEHHLQLHPLDDPVEQALLRRELHLAGYADTARSASKRMASAVAASDILRQLIKNHPQHQDALSWQLLLGRDLIDRHAEPHYNNVLFRTASTEDLSKLRHYTSEALAVYDALLAEIDGHLDGIEEMPAREFEQMANDGAFDRLEELRPKAQYLKQWASYYSCLAIEANDVGRHQRLTAIIEHLTRTADLLRTPHETSHYQAQSLLLAGMTHRLLGEDHRAEAELARAVDVVDQLPDAVEQAQLSWVKWTAELERIKNFRDGQRFDEALRIARRYRKSLDNDDASFSLRFALALIEGSVHGARADYLPTRMTERRQTLRAKARQPLIDLARKYPAFRDDVYRAVFDTIPRGARASELDAFEGAVVVARLIQQASGLPQRKEARRRRELLARAERIARRVLEDSSEIARQLHPEARFNLAVCYHEQGQRLAAIEQFNTLVASARDFERHRQAAQLAVRLADAKYRSARSSDRDIVRPYLVQALSGILEHYSSLPGTEARRFDYAMALQDSDAFEAAATEYERLTESHPQYIESRERLATCYLAWAKSLELGARRMQLVIKAAQAAKGLRERTADAAPLHQHLIGASLLISAECELMNAPVEPRRALSHLQSFNRLEALPSDLLGRGMRLRILALQADGRSDEAAAIIPDYIAHDPNNAGATLQGLLRSLQAEIHVARRKGDIALARSKSIDALVVARELAEWAQRPTTSLEFDVKLALRLAYGEALLATQRPDDASLAVHVFKEAVAADAERHGGRSANGRALIGLARSQLQAGQFADALVLFSRIHRDSKEDTAMWWDAFCGELSCRSELDQDPQILYNVIEQKKAFYRHLGGPDRRRILQNLQTELRRRSNK
jgi:hypothetical protein